MIVSRSIVERPNKDEDSSFVYVGPEYSYSIVNNTQSGTDAPYTVSGTTSACNAGSYVAIFTLNPNYKWSTAENNSFTDPYVINWSIQKAPVKLFDVLDKDANPKTATYLYCIGVAN